jgi:linoleoyl-CoA desaturase
MQLKGYVKFIDKDKTNFYPVLKKRVDAYFIENNLSKHANAAMVIKTCTLLCTYIFPFILMLVVQPAFGWSLFLWSIMGISVAGIGMSVMHDANHGAYSDNKKINEVVGSTLNLLGGSVFNWKLQHNVLHHTYTNITHVDDDISDRLVLKFSPHTRVKKIHRFQWIYAFLFYGLLTFYWAVAKDFVQFVQFSKNKVNPNSSQKNRIVLMKIIGIKILYFAIIILLPLYCGMPFLQVMAGFMLMHFFAGLILTTVFQLAHTLEHTAHPMPNEHGIIENDWAIHQLQTTVNFSPDHKFCHGMWVDLITR